MNMSSEQNLRLGLTMASAGGAFALGEADLLAPMFMLVLATAFFSLSTIALRREEQAAAPGSTGAS